MAAQESRYNNIFNKKNIELTLDGKQTKLPYSLTSDVELKANQIIFTSINNIFQRLLDNDLYNEAILKKYVEDGLIGGPTYVSSLNAVDNSAFLNKKFVVSGENGLSVLRKEEKDVADTLSGRFLDGTTVNAVTSINQRFIACTENGIYESLDKVHWQKTIGEDNANVVALTYNYNYLKDNVVSGYDYIAAVNAENDVVFYGHNGIDGKWKDFSKDELLSSITIENNTATKIFSFEGDSNLYVGTKNNGLLASRILTASEKFSVEPGTFHWTINDMAKLPDESKYSDYILATNYGLKQSQKQIGFENLKTQFVGGSLIYDAIRDRNRFFVATGEGLKATSTDGRHDYTIEGLNGIACYSLAKNDNTLYVGTASGLYSVPLSGEEATLLAFENKQIRNIVSFEDAIFVYEAAAKKIYYFKTADPYKPLSIDFAENEFVRQFAVNKNKLYILTNKKVYSVISGQPEVFFVWTDTVLDKDEILFAKNLDNDKILVQTKDKLFVLDKNNGNEDFSVDFVSDKIIYDASSYGEDQIFFILDDVLYKAVKNSTIEEPTVSKVKLNGTEVTAKKLVCFRNDAQEINGIVLLDVGGSLKLLQYDGINPVLLRKIRQNDYYSNISVFKDAVYTISVDNFRISKFVPKDQTTISVVEELPDNNGIGFHEYANKMGLVLNGTPVEIGYLSLSSNLGELEIADKQLQISSQNNGIKCGDFIGYIDNVDKKKTLLLGMNSTLSAFSFDVVKTDTDELSIGEASNMSVKNAPQNPTAFADVCYRDPSTNVVLNALNFVGTNNGLYEISAEEKFIEKPILSAITSITDVATVGEDKIVATNLGIYRYDSSSKENFVQNGFNTETRSFSKHNETTLAASEGQNVLISANTIANAWNPVFQSQDGGEFTLISDIIVPDVWEGVKLDKSISSIRTDGTLKYAYAQNDYTVNGVEFRTIGNYLSNDDCIIWPSTSPANTAAFDPPTDVEDDNYRRLLKHSWWKGQSTRQIELRNLDIGKKYLVQIIAARGNYTTQTATIDDTEATIHFGGEGWEYGGSLIGIFKATDVTKTFAIRYIEQSLFNAIQVRELNEEPSQKVFNLSSNYGGLLEVKRSTISNLDESALPSILKNPQELHPAEPLPNNFLKYLSAVYCEGNAIKAESVYGKVYRLDVNSENEFTATEIAGAQAKQLSGILTDKLANYFPNLSTSLSIAQNLENIYDAVSAVSLIDNEEIEENVEQVSSIEFPIDKTEEDIAVFSRHYQTQTLNPEVVLNCQTPSLSLSVDFGKSVGISSLIAEAIIQLSTTALSDEYGVVAKMSVDIYGDHVPAMYWGAAPLSIYWPDEHNVEISVIVNNGEQLSDIEITNTVEFLSVTTCTSSYALCVDGLNSFLFEPSEFSNAVEQTRISGGESFDFNAALIISGIGYIESEETPSLCVSYGAFGKIAVPTEISKELPQIQETNDGLYYDSVHHGTNPYFGYCTSSNAISLLYAIDDLNLPHLYSFNGFNVHQNAETVGLVQIAHTSSDVDFNDLYYFKTENNYDTNPIRKTVLGTHDKDFYIAKYSDTQGDINKVTFENERVFVLKGNELYSTNADLFPLFSKIADSADDVESCPLSTLVKHGNVISAIVNGTITGSASLPSNVDFKNFFKDDENVFIATSDGIKILRHRQSWQLSTVSDFSEKDNVKALFEDQTGYHTQVVIGNAYLCAKEKVYDFSNGGYVKVLGNTLTEEIVDMKTISSDSSFPRVFVATSDSVYRCEINDIQSNPALAITKLSGTVSAFNNIKAIYFSERNDAYDFYILNGADLYVYQNFNMDGNVLTEYKASYEVLDPSEINSKVTIGNFKDLRPAITTPDSVNVFDSGMRFREICSIDSQLSVSRIIDDKYLYSQTALYRLSNNSENTEFSLQTIGTYPNGLIDESKPIVVQEDSDDINHVDLWGVNENKAQRIVLSAGAYLSSEAYDSFVDDTTFNAFVFINDEIYAGMKGAVGGLYKLEPRSGFIENTEEDEVVEAAAKLSNDELFALAFAKNAYVINYVASVLVNEVPVRMSLVKSNNDDLENDINRNYVSNAGTTILNTLFESNLLISDGTDGYLYDINRKTGSHITLSQLERMNNGLASLLFVKNDSRYGMLGYGNAFCTFNGFGGVKVYGEVNKEKYVALANNFKRGTLKINVLNEVPDCLIGTTYGAKYVYNSIMTKSFYDKDNGVAINGEVRSIEKVLDANNDNVFLIGSDNKLFEVSDLKNAKFRKICEFDQDEQILDLFSMQKNEYLIATTKGIYATSLSYTLLDDLHKYTLDNIYEIVNDELKKLIANHIAAEHKPTSIVSKINAKADNTLSFITTKSKQPELYDSSIANSVKIVKDDVIDSIIIGGQTPESDSYVKVGVKNWATNVIPTEATYTNDGFVNVFTDPNTGKVFDISTVPYIVKNWRSGIKEIFIYVPSTGTYYANNPQGISNSQYSYRPESRANVENTTLLNTLPTASTTLRVYLYNSYFKIKTIVAAQCTGNSLPLKIYKDNTNADDAWKGVFDTTIQPSALRTLPVTVDSSVNNVSNCTDDLERIYLDFSIYGTDAQAIRIIAES